MRALALPRLASLILLFILKASSVSFVYYDIGQIVFEWLTSVNNILIKLAKN